MSEGFFSLSGIAFAVSTASEIQLTMSNNWVNYGGGFTGLSYSFHGSLCVVHGLIKNGVLLYCLKLHRPLYSDSTFTTIHS
jgi:hypothetical protein